MPEKNDKAWQDQVRKDENVNKAQQQKEYADRLKREQDARKKKS